ncbi:unnamed protein product [marine sediment metagenome]|uniref:Uncharacterized protein n=1 Tax=marine sediment metagenome TaxID=412755 RepID=X1J2S2_9ZZZZ
MYNPVYNPVDNLYVYPQGFLLKKLSTGYPQEQKDLKKVV